MTAKSPMTFRVVAKSIPKTQVDQLTWDHGTSDLSIGPGGDSWGAVIGNARLCLRGELSRTYLH